MAVGLDNVELVSHLHNAAFYDQLSKLPNRTRLVEILDATLAGPAKEDATQKAWGGEEQTPPPPAVADTVFAAPPSNLKMAHRRFCRAIRLLHFMIFHWKTAARPRALFFARALLRSM